MTGEPGAEDAFIDEGMAPWMHDPNVLAWAGEHLPELRRSVSGRQALHRSLWIGFVVGLVAHVTGYLLKVSVTTKLPGLFADLLYTLGWALWTGVVVVVFFQLVPELKARQIKRAADALEAVLRDARKDQPMTQNDHHLGVEELTQACAATGSILDHVTPEQLALSTPCGDWPVHELVNHIVGATRYFADLAEWGSSPEGQDWPNYADGDFAASFGEQARRAIAAFSAPGAMERLMVVPLAEPMPGWRCIQVATGEIFVHGWDLARATGQALPDEGVADALLSSEWVALCDEVRNESGAFAAAVEVPGEAPAADRLAGFLGREPSWPGGQ